FISKRERSFLRHLQRHLPARIKKPNYSSPSSSSRVGSSFRPPTLSVEEELRELFLDIIMRGGVLPVAKLDVQRMSLAENLVERNILRWRDSRIRKRENRAAMRPGWVPPTPSPSGGLASPDGDEEEGSGAKDEDAADGGIGAAGSVLGSPDRAVAAAAAMATSAASAASAAVGSVASSAAVGSMTSRVFGLARPDTWFKKSKNEQAQQHQLHQQQQLQQQQSLPKSSVSAVPSIVMSQADQDWNGPVIENQWAGAVSEAREMTSPADLDAAEQLAVFAMEGAEL
ncbi:hypothetical protein HDU76_010678, partial [Blyttiomyces sp. JEL0837]